MRILTLSFNIVSQHSLVLINTLVIDTAFSGVFVHPLVDT